MVTYREILSSLRKLGLDHSIPVVVHASLSSFGEVHGGVETLLGALLATVDSVIMPTFTYKTMLVPEQGPDNNAMLYGSGKDRNAMADFFSPMMPADRLMGALAEALRCHPHARRSMHPILSFAGIRVEAALNSQTLAEPMAPLQALVVSHGWVLLLGVNHMVNTSIHLAERLAGRKQFIRWALTPQGVVECPAFPGCSDGFQALAPHVEGITRRVKIGNAEVQALSLVELLTTVQNLIAKDPLALLCEHSFCERCEAVRNQETL